MIRDACTRNHVDNKFNERSIIKINDHVDFNDKNLDNVQFIEINSILTLEGQLTPKIYADQAISDGADNSSLLRLEPDKKLKLDEQDSIVLNSTLTIPKTIIELLTESYIDRSLNDPSII